MSHTRDDFDDDDEEMASMRKSQQYSQAMGKLAAARRVQQERRQIEDEIASSITRQARENASRGDSDSDERGSSSTKQGLLAEFRSRNPLTTQGDENEDDIMRSQLPISFGGAKYQKPQSSSAQKGKIQGPTLKFGKIGSTVKPSSDDEDDEDEQPQVTFSSTHAPRQQSAVIVGPPRPSFLPKAKDEDTTATISLIENATPANDDELVGPPRPQAGGSSSSESSEDKDFVGPPRPQPGESSEEESDEDDGDGENDGNDKEPTKDDGQYFQQRKDVVVQKAKFFGDDEEVAEQDVENDQPKPIPIVNEAIIHCHSKAVSALALDPSGSRLVTGSYDYEMKLFDFNGMDQRLRPFRSLEPSSGYQIIDLDYSSSGDRILVTLGSAQPVIYDRDGFRLAEFVKGDQYLYDMGQTKGHVATVVSGRWHPVEHDTILTASKDATVRIWDANNERKHLQLMRVNNSSGLKSSVSTASWAKNGSLAICGTDDGSIQAWPKLGPYNKTTYNLNRGHQGPITSIKSSKDGNTIITRGSDHTLKVWDLRRFKTPMASFDDLNNDYDMTDCAFSPDDRLILTGTSVKKRDGSGLLVFFDKLTLKKTNQYGVSEGASVMRVLWHPHINQIIATTSKGQAHVYYDPLLSKNGAKLCAERKPRKIDPSDDIQELLRPIVIPHAILKPETRQEHFHHPK
eukprot:TRINITY_DN8822_c0_g1_i2.p1 TRINITY_DN8822_c0_g1~~TRINITY_DN8822_c0_g1_i2.p1  ORF type:complete len:685 (+),score=153.64 TRINITY_DN8822_c0_g1_i2:75-2129(+)